MCAPARLFDAMQHTDVTDRLRKQADTFRDTRCELLHEAADEIVRLRRELAAKNLLLDGYRRTSFCRYCHASLTPLEA